MAAMTPSTSAIGLWKLAAIFADGTLVEGAEVVVSLVDRVGDLLVATVLLIPELLPDLVMVLLLGASDAEALIEVTDVAAEFRTEETTVEALTEAAEPPV